MHEMDEFLRIVPPADPVGAVSFTEFVLAEHADLYSALCLVTRERVEAEDVMQEALLRVWERWDWIRQMDSPAGYPYRTAFNVWRKRRRSAVRAFQRVAGLTEADDLSEVESRVEVVGALASLTPRQRAAVVLIDLLGYPSAEAGSILGIKASTARTLAFQARVQLRRRIGEIDE